MTYLLFILAQHLRSPLCSQILTMKDVPFHVLVWILLPHCLNTLHICPSFPYCALLPTGLWSSLPLILRPPISDAPVLKVTQLSGKAQYRAP